MSEGQWQFDLDTRGLQQLLKNYAEEAQQALLDQLGVPSEVSTYGSRSKKKGDRAWWAKKRIEATVMLENREE